MAIVPYYSQTKVKLDLRITDTSQDTQLDNWAQEAEDDIDSKIYSTVSKQRLMTKLPVLPFTAGSVPGAIQAAANHYVMMRYYEFVRNPDMQALQAKAWKEQVDNYVSRLDTDKIMYGRIIR